MLRKLVSICLICFSMLIFCTPISALETPNQLSRYEDFLTDFYRGKTEAYTILDINGNEVSDQFYQDTITYAQQKNWNKIEQYCLKNLKALYKSEIYTSEERAQELKKTEIRDGIMYVDGVSGPHYEDYRVAVDFQLEGTIWYLVDTGTITDAEAAIINVYLAPGCEAYNASMDAKISKDQRSATIEGSLYTRYSLTYDGLQMAHPVYFEPAECSFTMYV